MKTSNVNRNWQHLIFCPKYRRNPFTNPTIAARCERHIRHIANLKGIEIIEISVQPDHIHILLGLHTMMSIGKAAQLIKWFSSIWLRKEFPQLKQIHSEYLWGRHFFNRSVSPTDRSKDGAKVRQYIRNQEKKAG